jgi:hypothetical protein
MRGLGFIQIVLALAAILAISSPAAAMTFERLPDAACDGRACVLLSGAIDGESAGKFKAFSRHENLPAGSVVMLSSDGGNLVGGLTLGREIRAAGFSTEVEGYNPSTRQFSPGICASACVWAFLGGIQRTLSTGSKLGVHQVTFEVETVSGVADAQWLMGMVGIHLKVMGVASDILTLALTTPSDRIRWLSADELKRYAVATA